MNESETEPTSLPSQPQSTTADIIDRTAFVRRLRIAFNHAPNAEIARRIGTTDATIKAYTDGKFLPVAEMLARIAQASGVNIHWLLTGDGPERVTRIQPVFSEAEEDVIRKMAVDAGRTYEEQVRVLALAAAQLMRTVK